jgi:hypothetical protein
MVWPTHYSVFQITTDDMPCDICNTPTPTLQDVGHGVAACNECVLIGNQVPGRLMLGHIVFTRLMTLCNVGMDVLTDAVKCERYGPHILAALSPQRQVELDAYMESAR